MRRATFCSRINHQRAFGISIHALHEESDPSPSAPRSQDAISIHALHEESDLPAQMHPPRRRQFQSTLSMRRATDRLPWVGPSACISIHALHEESDEDKMDINMTAKISIHALHEESDPTDCDTPTLTTISIHALHEESDAVNAQRNYVSFIFQSTLSMRRAT